jgi:hypothetical protein
MAARVRNVSFADITGPAKGADGSLPEGQGAIVYEYSDDNHDDLMDALSVLLVKNRPVVLVIFLNPLNAKSDTETQTQADRRGNRWHEGVVFLADMAIAVTEEEAAAGNAIYFTTAFDSPKEAGDATMTALGAVEESYQGKLAAGDFNKDQIAFYFTDGMAAAHLASTHGRLKKGAKHNWHLPAKAVSAPDCLPAYPFFRLLLTCVPAYLAIGKRVGPALGLRNQPLRHGPDQHGAAKPRHRHHQQEVLRGLRRRVRPHLPGRDPGRKEIGQEEEEVPLRGEGRGEGRPRGQRPG